MIERHACLAAAADECSADASDCLSVWSECAVCIFCCCGDGCIGDEFKLLIELERALFVDAVEWVDLNVLWLAVGLCICKKKPGYIVNYNFDN